MRFCLAVGLLVAVDALDLGPAARAALAEATDAAGYPAHPLLHPASEPSP
jgi:hypothetical protein